jgi:hypothetical protein
VSRDQPYSEDDGHGEKSGRDKFQGRDELHHMLDGDERSPPEGHDEDEKAYPNSIIGLPEFVCLFSAIDDVHYFWKSTSAYQQISRKKIRSSGYQDCHPGFIPGSPPHWHKPGDS